MRFETDVLIVGAGSAGSFLGWKLAQKGCKVHILEAQPLKNLGQNIEVIHLDQVRLDEFEVPRPISPELLHLVPAAKVWGVGRKSYFEVHYPWYVVNMPLFLQRLHGYCRDQGVAISENACVDGLILEGGALKGMSGKVNGEAFQAYARIVVDASGIAGAVRTRLPADFGVENAAVTPQQTFYCALELRDQIPAGYPTGNNTFLGEPGFWNRSYSEGAILGVVAPGSAEAAWQLHQVWRETSLGEPGRLVAKRIGMAPYRRPPLSLVGNGFLGVGDSVYQNKAFSGEGITSGFTGASIASEVILRALKEGDFSRAALWEYNLRYHRGQGAKFAGVMVLMSVLNGLPKEDVDFLYQHQIIHSAPDTLYLNEHYEYFLPPDRWQEISAILKKGVESHLFSEASFTALMNIYPAACLIKELYLAYPAFPQDFPEWCEKVNAFWGYM